MMKEVEINGQLVPFEVMKTGNNLTESVEPNLIGYSKVYFLDGVKFESLTPIRFYK